MRFNELLTESQYDFAGKKPGPLSNGSTPVYYFKTSKGSEYILFSQGELLRNKSEQGRGDAGIQTVSPQCIFVFARPFGMAIADIITSGKYYTTLHLDSSAKIASVLISDRSSKLNWQYAQYEILGGSAHGRIETKYSLIPIIGYWVVDYEMANGRLISVHPGHRITEVSKY